MSTKKRQRQAREARRQANARAAKVHIPAPPPLAPYAQKQELTKEALEAMIRASKNVMDIPLPLLRIHECHCVRNPYLNTIKGAKRRARLAGHIKWGGGWSDLACGVLIVCVDKHGAFWIVDGVGRLYMAAELSGGIVQTLPCRLLYGLDPAHVIRLFVQMGTQITRVTKDDEWRVSGAPDVAPITALEEKYGFHFPTMQLEAKRFAFSMKIPKTGEPALEKTIVLLNNTALGANEKYTSVMSSMTASLLGTQPLFDEERFRDVVPDNDGFAATLFEKAARKSFRLGFLRPHVRTIAWQSAILFGSDYYNPRLTVSRKLDVSALDELRTPFIDAYCASAAGETPRASIDEE